MSAPTFAVRYAAVLALAIASFLAAPGAGLAAPLSTGQDPLESMSLEELMDIPVYAASRYQQKTSEAPSAVTVVTADEIRKFGWRTLAEILRSQRGIFFSYDRNYTYLGMRGFNRPGDYNTRILLLVDGHRINDSVYDQASVGYEFPVDVDLIDRVELIRGPSSSLYGSNAFFGVVNVITRGEKALRGGEVSADAERYRTFKGRASYGNRYGDDLEIVLSGTAAHSRGPDLFFPEFNDPATNNGRADGRDAEHVGNALAKVAYKGLTLEGVYGRRTKYVPTASFGTIFNDPGARTIDERYYAELKIDREIAPETNLTAAVSYDWYRYWGDYYYEDTEVDPPERYLNKDLTVAAWWGAEVKVTKKVFGKHRVTVGGEHRDLFRQDQANSDFAVNLDDRRKSAVSAVYLQDEFEIARGLILNAGVRHDHYKTFGGTTNPRLALIYKPLDKTTLKLLFGRAFRAPNAYELYYNDGGILQKSNPDLKPETITTYEAVVEQYLGNNLRLVGSAYYYRIKNLISQRTDPADDNVVFGNAESIRAKGIEAELEGKWPSGVEGRVSVSHQKSEYEDGRRLENSPRTMVKLHLSAPVVRQRLFAGVEALSMSSRDPVPPKVTPAGARTLVNVTLYSPKVLSWLEAQASVFNLFNRKYGDPGTADHVQELIPQDGRNYRIKLTASF